MSKLVFQGGTMIDVVGRQSIPDSTIIIEKGRIVYAGERKPADADCRVTDITGMTVMPGLIDTHLHFSGNLTGNDTDWVLEDNIQKAVVAVQQAHECLESGLTTVGEISRFGIHIRNMIEQGVMTGPRIAATGLGFCATASHGDSHLLSAEKNRESHPWAECVDGPWELRKAVRKRIRENPDAIKIWATGGGIWRWDTPFDQHYTMEEIQAVADECKLRGIPLWAHCFGSAYNSVKAGADFIIHGFDLDDETMDMMTEKGVFFCPTVNFMPSWFEQFPPEYKPEIHNKYKGDTVAEKEMNRIYDNLKKAVQKGIKLTIGSDSFNSKMTPYGVTAIGELYDFVEKADISEIETIAAATINGAEALRVDSVTGSLEAGKSADLLVIDGEPLKNIRDINCGNMAIIMKEGRFIKRSRK